MATTTPTAPGSAKKEPLPIEVIAEPSCVARGATLTVRIRTAPGSSVAIAAVDGGRQALADPSVGYIPPSGELTKKYVVPATATPGTGSADVAGFDPATAREGAGSTTFQIADVGGC